MGTRVKRLAWAVVSVLLAPGRASAETPMSEGSLGFQALLPCRLADTRLWNLNTGSPTPMPLAAGEVRAFDAVDGFDLRRQGGGRETCGVPSATDPGHRAEAIVVNLIAVGAAGPGDLRAFPGNLATGPLSSVINYVAGQTIATGTVIPLRTDQFGGDFKIQADVSGTHVVIDVVGYYSRGTLTAHLALLRRIPSGAGPDQRFYGAMTGIDVASGTALDHAVVPPRHCLAQRIEVRESVSVPVGGGTRIYTLKAGTTPLLACATGVTGSCFSGGQAWLSDPVPPVYWEVFVTGVVPLTDASLTVELSCR